MSSNTFKMRCPAGVLIPKEDTAGVPKWAKFHNWPRDKKGQPLPDKPGFPVGEDIPEKIVEVPNDHHHATLVFKCGCSYVVVDDVPAPTPKPKKGDK